MIKRTKFKTKGSNNSRKRNVGDFFYEYYY